MVPVTRGRGNRFTHLEDMNSRKEPVREEPLATYQAYSEAQFMSLMEQIAAITKQLSIRSGRDRCWHIPLPHELEEEDAHMENEDGNPFVEHRVYGHQPIVQAQANRWESGFKLDIPEFNNGLQPKEFLDWMQLKKFLNSRGFPWINEFLWSRPNSRDKLQHSGSN
jgi:hypothetical protein